MLDHCGQLDGKTGEELSVGESEKVLAQDLRPEVDTSPVGPCMMLRILVLCVCGDVLREISSEKKNDYLIEVM